MALHVWQNYKLYAWGKNELRPLSKEANKDGFFRGMDLGTTIVDGLDTLYIMGLNEQYEEGRDWIARRFTLKNLVNINIFGIRIKLKSEEIYSCSCFRVEKYRCSTQILNLLVDFCQCTH